jgi:nucleoside-diphosphate-sugar epimerase
MPQFTTAESLSSVSPATPSKRILITGATGMIGSALRKRSVQAGWSPTALQRPPSSGNGADAPSTRGPSQVVFWNPSAAEPFADLDQLEGFDAVVHLAGANLSAHRRRG